jgi:large subunit ribosomal protein L30
MTKSKQAPKMLRITLVKSGIGYPVRQKNTLKALGFHHLNQTVEHEDSPELRGMLEKVSHLVEVESQEN